jgi:hypothetical protein
MCCIGGVRFPAWWDFTIFRSLHHNSGACICFNLMGIGERTISPTIKRPGREAENSSPAIIEVKNERTKYLLTHVFMTCYLVNEAHGYIYIYIYIYHNISAFYMLLESDKLASFLNLREPTSSFAVHLFGAKLTSLDIYIYIYIYISKVPMFSA